jgi:hypothetical protein
MQNLVVNGMKVGSPLKGIGMDKKFMHIDIHFDL